MVRSSSGTFTALTVTLGAVVAAIAVVAVFAKDGIPALCVLGLFGGCVVGLMMGEVRR
jgi:hypothetical protein